TFRRVDPADIKGGFKKVFTTDAQAFADSLELDKLAPVKEARPEDARLVIELTSEKGAVVTYYASRFNLCTLDNKSKRPIDEAFRKRFTDLSHEKDTQEAKKEGTARVSKDKPAKAKNAPAK
ncbi:MAG TPA: hypothetical protein VHM91_15855, partial [Verrucomicrobiales bacterium]|nr:hypothetical protein [Verrucomicrobiales bacterium]